MIKETHLFAFLKKYGYEEVSFPNVDRRHLVSVRLASVKDGSLGIFAMLVDRIPPHRHERTLHTYMLLSGKLQFNRIEIEGVANRFTMEATAGNPATVVVHANQPHVAWAIGTEPAEMVMITQPANVWDDFHHVSSEQLTKLMNGHSFCG